MTPLQLVFLVPANFVMALLVPVRATGQETSTQIAPACRVESSTPKRLELNDGRIVSVDFRAFARAGSTVLALGRHAYVFPRTAGPITPPQFKDSILGVTINGRGTVDLVPNPSLPVRAFHPRVAAAPNGGFHALWVTGLDSVADLAEPEDTMTLWYATYDRGRWSVPSKVTTLRGARLEPELGTPLLERDRELGIMFTFVETRSGELQGGVILLRRRGDRWTADTLRTRFVPQMVRALPTRQGFIALLALADTSFHRAEGLYFTRFENGWAKPVRLAGDGSLSVTLPALVPRGQQYIASWVEWRWLDSESARLYWMVLDSAGRSLTRGSVDAGAPTYPYELASIDNSYPLWLYRGTPPNNLVALAIGRDTTISKLPQLVTPFRNPVPAVLPLSGRRFLLFTQKLALADNEPMAASFVTELEFHCSRGGQR